MALFLDLEVGCLLLVDPLLAPLNCHESNVLGSKSTIEEVQFDYSKLKREEKKKKEKGKPEHL
jgi:hypothetical protein